jgi:hypothetical protein
MVLMGYSRARGTLIYKINMKAKISFQTPFKLKKFFFIFLRTLLLHLPPLSYHCVGGRWDLTQDCCDYGIDIQTSNHYVDLYCIAVLYIDLT